MTRDPRQGRGAPARPGREALFSAADPPEGEEPPPPAPGRRAFFSNTRHGAEAREAAAAGTSGPVVEPSPATAGSPGKADKAAEVTSGPAGSHMAGTVVIECRSCDHDTVVGLGRALRGLLPSLWLPVGRYNRFMRCPSCHRATWCRIDWTGSNPLR